MDESTKKDTYSRRGFLGMGSAAALAAAGMIASTDAAIPK
ncbi:MAG: twin-arginine translocation signal domain-containing protein [Candidatus Sulfotelmatobacter sp.]